MNTTELLVILFLFFLGSIVGWIMEFVFNRFNKKINPEGHFINPGFLSGPYLPIYGFGVVVLYILSLLMNDINFQNQFMEVVVVFFAASFLMTMLELIGGLFFIKVMKIKLWDYSDVKFNYKGIICLKFSILWGMVSLIYFYLLNPIIVDAVRLYTSNIEFSFIVGMFYGFLLIDLYKTMDVAANLRRFANENSAVLKYRNLKIGFMKEIAKQKRLTDIYKYPDPKTLKAIVEKNIK